MKLNRLAICLALLAGAVVAGCESTNAPSAPPITAAIVKSGGAQHANAAMLATGRALFVGRCAHCHALPDIGGHTAEQWPGIVAHMAKRSGLKPAEGEAVIAYIRAVRSQ